LVEGAKSVLELVNSTYKVSQIYATESFLSENGKKLQMLAPLIVECSNKELAAVSSLQKTDSVLAVVHIPNVTTLEIDPQKYYLALDRIRDPGNLGTIIRIADWYGFDKILCSADCADFYNPKVIQASMGSFTRVEAHYLSLEDWLPKFKQVYGAVLEGQNIHQVELTGGGAILIGNESQGISEDILPLLTHRLTVPSYGAAESLNAAVATAVLCDNLRRITGS